MTIEEKEEKTESLGTSAYNILSQDEISALLAPFRDEETVGETAADTIAGRDETPCPESMRKHVWRHFNPCITGSQPEKEKRLIREKKRAAALIRNLLRMEEKRIRQTAAVKSGLTDGNLYARYEIICADRTRMTVSMSKEAAARYRLEHPGDCIYRI